MSRKKMWQRLKVHLRHRLLFMVLPDRQGKIFNLSLPVYIIYSFLLLGMGLAGLGLFLYRDYRATKQEIAASKRQIHRQAQANSRLREQNQNLRELAQKAATIESRLQELDNLRKKIIVAAAENKLLPPQEARRVNWGHSRGSTSRGGVLRTLNRRDNFTPEELDASLSELAEALPEREKELRQLQSALEQYTRLVECYPNLWPVRGRISSRFGSRFHPLFFRRQMHTGIDIVVPPGTPVKAAAAGRVTYAGWRRGYGLMVQIAHGYGRSTLYGHNAKLAVRAGAKVEKGQVIAYSGNTGNSTGPHLHYEVHSNGRPVNPLAYLP